MDILIIISLISLGAGLLMASLFCKSKRKSRKHKIVQKLRAKAHQMEWVLDTAKNAQKNEKKVLKNLNSFLHDAADEVEEL